MKKFLLSIFLLFFLLFVSCNSTSSNSEIKSDEVSRKAEDSIAKSAMKKHWADIAEQSKAIGDIKFYITEKQFDKDIEAFKVKLAEKDEIGIMRYKIGEYEFFTTYGLFHNDSLYSVNLWGQPISYEEYDAKMRYQFDALTTILKKKYGNPETETELPKWSSIQKGNYRRCAIWNIGDKTIEVRISCQGVYYRLDLIVFKPAILLRITDEDYLKSKNKSDSGATVI